MRTVQDIDRRQGGFPVRQVLDCFRVLEKRRPAVQINFRIAGEAVSFRFFSDDLARLLRPALLHARVDEPAADSILVDVCDRLTASPDDPVPQSGPADGHDAVTYHYSERGLHMTHSIGHETATLSAYDERRRRGWFWVPDAGSLPFYQVGHPFKEILHWILRAAGLQMVHAGAVLGRRGVVLFGGHSGSGKSTTSFSCLDGGLGYLGDDYVAVKTAGPPTAFCLYNSGNIAQSALNRFEARRLDLTRSHPWDGTKRMFFLHEIAPDEVVHSGPICALVLPRVAFAPRSEIRPLSRADALRRLAPSTMLQLPGADATDFGHLRALVDAVPSYELNLARTMDDVPALIESLPV